MNESLVKEMAGALITTGLRDLGFNYVHIDAGALTPTRGAGGELLENRTLFPSGMTALARWLHARELRLGVYTDIGNTSCGTGPGSYGHYESDARTFARWE